MQTPAAVYQPSARPVPARVPEPEYPESMLVRSVRPHGHFRWKKCDVFLSEVLWGERVGLLPADDRCFTIYFAQLPLARFDSHQLQVTSLPETGSGDNVTAREGAEAPSLAPHLRMEQHQKVSGMRPVQNVRDPPGRTALSKASMLLLPPASFSLAAPYTSYN